MHERFVVELETGGRVGAGVTVGGARRGALALRFGGPLGGVEALGGRGPVSALTQADCAQVSECAGLCSAPGAGRDRAPL